MEELVQGLQEKGEKHQTQQRRRGEEEVLADHVGVRRVVVDAAF